jgi:hypothetical protein
MGLGITGGKLLDFEGTGKRIAELTLRVLAGERPEQIPQETAPSVLVVDWRELQRWGIAEGGLPPGTLVRFKQPSFWEVYKWYAFGLVGGGDRRGAAHRLAVGPPHSQTPGGTREFTAGADCRSRT